jgi:NhaA family Na+:H+ antiporter
MEAFGAQRGRFHVGSLEDGQPGANGSEARSALASLLAAAVLVTRNRQYRVEADEAIDTDRDGVPDVYEEDRRP